MYRSLLLFPRGASQSGSRLSLPGGIPAPEGEPEVPPQGRFGACRSGGLTAAAPGTGTELTRGGGYGKGRGRSR